MLCREMECSLSVMLCIMPPKYPSGGMEWRGSIHTGQNNAKALWQHGKAYPDCWVLPQQRYWIADSALICRQVLHAIFASWH